MKIEIDDKDWLSKRWYYWLLLFIKINILVYFKKITIYYKDEEIILKKSIFGFINLIKDYLRITYINYKRCFFSKESKNADAFVRYYAQLFYWYKTVGMKMRDYGCWGYSYFGNCGFSNKEDFYRTLTTYGIYTKFRFRNIQIFVVSFIIASFLLISIIREKYLIGFILVFLLPFLRYFQLGFLKFVKAENIGWILTPFILFLIITKYNIILLALLLFIQSYLNFSVLFMYSFYLLIGFYGDWYSLFFIILPFSIKTGIDFYLAVRGKFAKTVFNMISGRFVKNNKRAYKMRVYGFNYPTRKEYKSMFIILIFLTILSFIYNDIMKYYFLLSLMFFFNQFFIIRTGDDNSFLRYFVILLGTSFIMSDTNFIIVLFILILYLSILGNTIGNKKDFGLDTLILKPEKIPEKFVIEVKKIFENKMNKYDRILFQSGNGLKYGKYRNAAAMIEHIAYTEKIDFLPDENAEMYYPDWFYKYGVEEFRPDGNLEVVKKMMENCYIKYVIVFSEVLLKRLEEIGFKKIGFVEYKEKYDKHLTYTKLNIKGFYFLESPYQTSLFEVLNRDASVKYEIDANKFKIDGVKEGDELLIKFVHHYSWKAYQGKEKLEIKPVKKSGLSFMRVKSKGEKQILFKFGKITKYIR